MAKVKIQGHASGTGVLTVTAPNTSTDRTITLPDSTDTLAVNSDVTNKLPLAGGNLTGNLGIGETSPATSIHITSDTPKIRLEHTNDNGYAEIYTSAQSAIVLDADPGNTDNGTPIVFKTDGTERMRVLDSGGLTFNGDTAAANALDDYEEGTWTPALTATTTAPSGMTYGFRSGDYTKIGDMVICRFGIKMNNIGSSGAGSVTIAGLPFTSISYGAYQEPNFSVASGNNSTASTHVRFFVQGGSTTCQGRRADTNADTVLVWSDLSNTSYFITCEIKYKTAS